MANAILRYGVERLARTIAALYGEIAGARDRGMFCAYTILRLSHSGLTVARNISIGASSHDADDT
ncbi:hypothetical protein ADT25_05850 [Xanthomonas oryzae]|uniref:Uncharacterized protein n=1 Tax=Xanthomonas oryzae TaxID=347 RepID=A0AAP0ZMG4_9XANT|nr:hypothetical protein ADT25_05850 [Xanthomonas oryzae]QBG85485.1 hypothetical protein EYR27_18905 [Xanthomonas oryzae]